MLPRPALVDLPDASEAADLRLVALDMDGTLLDADHEVDPSFWPVADELERRGVVLCAASGRQRATLEEMFGARAEGMVLIAENGADVVHHGRRVSTSVVSRDAVVRAVETVRGLAHEGEPVGTVLSGAGSAYVERHDDAFLGAVSRYYARLECVPDLLAVDDDALKVAVHHEVDVAARTHPALAPLAAEHTVVLSGEHWVDVMARGTDKGVALRRAQEALGVTAAQTAAFGDHLNDLELLAAAGMSFAMANGHPDVRAAARFVAPPHTENGVTRVLAALLDLAG
ncbi:MULTISPECIES: Cof-type HAD-IIB family hydrolase [unclassified Actinotalea]|uniref:Cof-type HAD-IIB family hydrolase n=1 Tax=unclassified Actinotalea TaxID=2638618 RepID=UPI002107D666|nr:MULTISPECIES: Cof-type HAD-IIB family hydrolase [unclassified Actinotalea]